MSVLLSSDDGYSDSRSKPGLCQVPREARVVISCRGQHTRLPEQEESAIKADTMYRFAELRGRASCRRAHCEWTASKPLARNLPHDATVWFSSSYCADVSRKCLDKVSFVFPDFILRALCCENYRSLNHFSLVCVLLFLVKLARVALKWTILHSTTTTTFSPVQIAVPTSWADQTKF